MKVAIAGAMPAEKKSQTAIKRRNLVHLCSYVLKAVIDKDVHVELNDNDCDVANLCAILEQAVCDGLKVSHTWYGSVERRWAWEFLRAACRHVAPNNCVDTVLQLEDVKTAQGKTRALLRMALMEKKLDQYLSVAYGNTKLCREFYTSDALLCSDDAAEFLDLLRGLQTIDFSFVLRGQQLDDAEVSQVDLTPYLKYSGHGREDDQWQVVSERNTGSSEEQWRTKYEMLEHKHRLLLEQKSYVEEVLRSRDSQLRNVQADLQRTSQSLHQHQGDSACHQRQLETVIMELQTQLASLQQLTGQEMNALHSFDSRTSSIAMTSLMARDKPPAALDSTQTKPPPQLTVVAWSGDVHTVSLLSSTSSTERADTASYSRDDTSLTRDDISLTRDDTPSLTVFTGSLTSSAIAALRETSCDDSGDVFMADGTRAQGQGDDLTILDSTKVTGVSESGDTGLTGDNTSTATDGLDMSLEQRD